MTNNLYQYAHLYGQQPVQVGVPGRKILRTDGEGLYWVDANGNEWPVAGADVANKVVVVTCNAVQSVAIPHTLGRLPLVAIYDENGTLCYARVDSTDTQTTLRFGSDENPISFTGWVLVS